MFGFMVINNPLLCRLTCLLFLLAIGGYVSGQDLEQVLKSKPVTVRGGLSTSSSVYNTWGMTSRRDPYFWQLNANINFNIYGVLDVPFSASFSKANQQYQQPSFKQFGASPHYKAFTVHLGYRSMTLSQYSLSGLTFLGVGAEYKPSDFWLNVSAMYGRFTKAISPADSLRQMYEPVSYKRMGSGLKLIFLPKNQTFELVFFKGWDDANSLHDTSSIHGITPADNFILGFASRNKLSDKISIQTEYSLSAYTTNTNTPLKQFDKYSYLNNLGNLYKPRYSSSIGHAYSVGLTYQGSVMGYGITYKRVDPGYQSLGSTYIENDLEDVLFSVNSSLFKNKVTISSSLGQQRNNLDNDQQTVSKRVIGSANVSYLISQSLNCNVSYSNYTTSSQPTTINFGDSIRYYQINKNTSVALNYNTGSSEVKHGVSLVVAYQDASTLNQTATERLRTGTTMVNSNLSYQLNMVKQATAITVAFQQTNYKAGTSENNSFGPSLSLQKALVKNKLKLTGSYGYQATTQSGANGGSASIFRLNANIQVHKRHALRWSSSYSVRNQSSSAGIQTHTREFQSALQYQLSF